jgi:uncharacterized repeat protein (TIGR04138 family)
MAHNGDGGSWKNIVLQLTALTVSADSGILLHMQAMQFEQSVVSILKRDKRFDAHAYFFLKDALDFTLKRIADANAGQSRHVSGPELLEGFRDFSLEQFGPMAATLMKEWGVRKCQDVGDMVFHLIEEQVFGKQDSDRREDFSEAFDFEDSLVKPFLPQRLAASPAQGTRKQKAAS